MNKIFFISSLVFCVILLGSCKKSEKCDIPTCPTNGTISYNIKNQSNLSSYSIDCDKDIICVCFCADIPDDLQGELWTANVLEAGTPIHTITAENVGNVWEDKIPVNAEIYGTTKSNLSVEVFIGATNSNRIQSNLFSWTCE